MKSAGHKTSLHLAKDNIPSDIKKDGERVARAQLINYLNRINFRDGDITLHFRHRKYGHVITLQAIPQICNNDFMRCHWSEHADAEKRLKYYNFIYLSFADGLKHFHVEAKLIELTKNGVYLELPEACLVRKAREIKRHKCQGVTAQISQNSRIIQGFLESFSAQSLGIKFSSDSSYSGMNFDEEIPLNVVLCRGSKYIYSGNCDILRQEKSEDGLFIVLKPVKTNISIFKPKEVRSERLRLSPIPNIIFEHPITQKKISLGLHDISGTGFAVEEDEDNAILMPGMIYPDLEIEFLQGFRVKCNAQVIYRNYTDDHVICGMVILDMSVQDHLRLSSFLHQAKNRHSFISTTNVDLDALWDFFFESGFVYPAKYLHIAEQKERFRNLYKKLYNENPEIFRHVIYQDRGKIYGHVSMFRYYQNTWLMHHHAAVKSSKHKAGLVVMEHILQYINECHTLASSKMKYIACYFRTNNRFANRVFGGSVRFMNDTRKCSSDDFAYFHFDPTDSPDQLAPDWTLTPSQHDDLLVFEQWYGYQSGGLLLKALDLTVDALEKDIMTNREYENAEFKRMRELYSLKYDEELMALIIINRSDLGLNMSDLTNCIQVFVLEEKQVPKDILDAALNTFSQYYEQDEIPVLLNPSSYAEIHSMRFEKIYELSILDLDYISPYLQFIQSLTSQRTKKIKDHTILSGR